jgi:hypothetical protein
MWFRDTVCSMIEQLVGAKIHKEELDKLKSEFLSLATTSDDDTTKAPHIIDASAALRILDQIERRLKHANANNIALDYRQLINILLPCIVVSLKIDFEGNALYNIDFVETFSHHIDTSSRDLAVELETKIKTTNENLLKLTTQLEKYQAGLAKNKELEQLERNAYICHLKNKDAAKVDINRLDELPDDEKNLFSSTIQSIEEQQDRVFTSEDQIEALTNATTQPNFLDHPSNTISYHKKQQILHKILIANQLRLDSLSQYLITSIQRRAQANYDEANYALMLYKAKNKIDNPSLTEINTSIFETEDELNYLTDKKTARSKDDQRIPAAFLYILEREHLTILGHKADTISSAGPERIKELIKKYTPIEQRESMTRAITHTLCIPIINDLRELSTALRIKISGMSDSPQPALKPLQKIHEGIEKIIEANTTPKNIGTSKEIHTSISQLINEAIEYITQEFSPRLFSTAADKTLMERLTKFTNDHLIPFETSISIEVETSNNTVNLAK